MNPRVLLSVTAGLLLAGCLSVHTITKAELDAKYQESYYRSLRAIVYYCGSADGFDYFVVRNTGMLDFHCRIPATDPDLVRTPFGTSNWVRYDMDKELKQHLATGAEIFKRLEQQQKLIDSLPKSE